MAWTTSVSISTEKNGSYKMIERSDSGLGQLVSKEDNRNIFVAQDSQVLTATSQATLCCFVLAIVYAYYDKHGAFCHDAVPPTSVRDVPVAILVSIFFTQVLSFYEEQFLALLGLILDILVLGALRYMITHEDTRKRSQLTA